MNTLNEIFEKFDDNIRIGYDFNSELKDKKDLLISELKDQLNLNCTFFAQGSYAIHTGVKPVSGDYDIDIAVIFKEKDLEEIDIPYNLKKKVYDCFARYTKRLVEIVSSIAIELCTK